MTRSPSPPSEVIRGQIESIRLLKDGWGKMAVRIGTGEGHVVNLTSTVLGHEPGATIEARGRWSEHPAYGKQFAALTIEVVIPQDAGGAIAFLAASCPGIGRKRAAEVIERFGAPPALWALIESDPSRLTEIRGITPAGATLIAEALEKTKSTRDDAVRLRGWGLTDWQIKAVRDHWKERAVEELQRDPYQLAEHVRGFGFTRADTVAMAMGTPKDAPARIRAALCHLLEQAEGEGHCFVPGGKLVAFAAKLLGGDVAEPTVARELVALEGCTPPRVVRDGTRCYRPATHAAECEVSAAVGSLLAWVGVSEVEQELATRPASIEERERLADAEDARDEAAGAFGDGQPVPDDDEWADFDRGAA